MSFLSLFAMIIAAAAVVVLLYWLLLWIRKRDPLPALPWSLPEQKQYILGHFALMQVQYRTVADLLQPL